MSESLSELKQQVLEANLELVRQGLVISTFGNASGISKDRKRVVIKPSGVEYSDLRSSNLVVTDLEGNVIEGSLRPSSDLPTHLILYNAFPRIGGVAHTHSTFATSWAQAGLEIPCFGTTHADYFHGPVPVTAPMQPHEIENEYERNTGEVIVRRFTKLDPMEFPSVLVSGHGPFSWGPSAVEAAHTAVLLEEIARMSLYTLQLNQEALPISPALLGKHFLRKHGPDAYCGQK